MILLFFLNCFIAASLYVGPNSNETKNGSYLFPFTDFLSSLKTFFQTNDSEIIFFPNESPYICNENYIFNKNITLK